MSRWARDSRRAVHARHPELERQILAEPERLDLRLVLADWLSEQGDPRGRLIALHARGEAGAAAAWIEKHHKHFFAGVVGAAEARELAVDWHLGYWRAVRLSSTPERHTASAVATRVAQVLRSPSAPFLEAVEVVHTSTRASGASAGVVAELLAQPPPLLRRLVLRVGGGGLPVDLAELWRRFPRLDDVLVLDIGEAIVDLDLAAESARRLRELELHVGHEGLQLRAIAAGAWPRLEQLVLHAASTVDPRALDALLAAAGLPALRRLILCGPGFTIDDLALDAPVVARLTILGLTDGAFVDDDERVLLAHAGVLGHLQALDLRGNQLDPRLVRRCARAGVTVAGIDDHYDGDVDPYDEP